MARFIDERIEVEMEGAIRQPKAFIWRGQHVRVIEVIHAWCDWGFSPAATQRNWRTRRHRNYYRLRAEDGRVFEIYLDRGTKPGRESWYLFQELDPEPNRRDPSE